MIQKIKIFKINKEALPGHLECTSYSGEGALVSEIVLKGSSSFFLREQHDVPYLYRRKRIAIYKRAQQ
jgi:hypothetical protein